MAVEAAVQCTAREILLLMTKLLRDFETAWPRMVLRRRDQGVAAALLAISLFVIAGWGFWQVRLRGRMIDIERAEPLAVDFKVDVNAAEWTELSLMPGIGPQLAKRIVAEREARGGFHKLTDLRQVRGIGVKTLEGMRPYLLPLSETAAKEGEKDGRDGTLKLD